MKGANNELIQAAIDSQTWEQLVNVCSAILIEAKLTFMPAGLEIRQLDVTKAAMLLATLPASDFIEYSAEEELEAIVNTSGLDASMKRIKNIKADVVRIKAPTGEGQTVTINAEGAKRNLSIELFLLHEEKEEKIKGWTDPKAGFTATFKIRADALKALTKDMAWTGAHVAITAGAGFVTFATESDDGKAQSTVIEGEDLPSIEAKTSVTSLFAVNYLTELFNAYTDNNAGTMVSVSMNKDAPIKIDLPLCKDGHLIFILAPRVERR